MEDYLFQVKNPTPENYMKMFGGNNIEIEKELAEEIATLAIKVRELPVSYIEAKPHRVVHFSEVAAVINPDTLSLKEEIKEAAKENNFKVYEYRDKKKDRKLFAVVLRIGSSQLKHFNNLKKTPTYFFGKRFYLCKNKAITLLSLSCISHQ